MAMADRDPQVVGTRIARRRQQLGWTQAELADRLGVSPSTVANWERGAAYPKKKLGLVEHVLGVTLDEPEPAEPILSPGLIKAIRDNIPDVADQERVMEFIRIMRTDPRLFAELVRRARSGQSPESGEGSGGRRYREDRAG